jgi:hypothetical protein
MSNRSAIQSGKPRHERRKEDLPGTGGTPGLTYQTGAASRCARLLGLPILIAVCVGAGARPPQQVIQRSAGSMLSVRVGANGPVGLQYTGYVLKLRDNATGKEVCGPWGLVPDGNSVARAYVLGAEPAIHRNVRPPGAPAFFAHYGLAPAPGSAHRR